MSPFITFRDTNKDGELTLYILQRDFPHYCGQLCYFPIAESICCVPISGHNIWLTFAGTLRGNYILSNNDALQQAGAIFERMAEWFYLNRIASDPKRYKKFSIPY